MPTPPARGRLEGADRTPCALSLQECPNADSMKCGYDATMLVEIADTLYCCVCVPNLEGRYSPMLCPGSALPRPPQQQVRSSPDPSSDSLIPFIAPPRGGLCVLSVPSSGLHIKFLCRTIFSMARSVNRSLGGGEVSACYQPIRARGCVYQGQMTWACWGAPALCRLGMCQLPAVACLSCRRCLGSGVVQRDHQPTSQRGDGACAGGPLPDFVCRHRPRFHVGFPSLISCACCVESTAAEGRLSAVEAVEVVASDCWRGRKPEAG